MGGHARNDCVLVGGRVLHVCVMGWMGVWVCMSVSVHVCCVWEDGCVRCVCVCVVREEEWICAVGVCACCMSIYLLLELGMQQSHSGKIHVHPKPGDWWTNTQCISGTSYYRYSLHITMSESSVSVAKRRHYTYLLVALATTGTPYTSLCQNRMYQ